MTEPERTDASPPRTEPAQPPTTAAAAERLDALARALEGHEKVLVYSHLNPDPDTVGAGLALQQLLQDRFGIEAMVCYRGMIGRAENRQLMRTLGRDMMHAAQVRQEEYDGAFLVDSQPDYGLRGDRDHVQLIGVIDHHPRGPGLGGVPFVDIRQGYGSTSTILWEYLRAAGVTPSPHVATALFYGLKTDTMDLSRRASPADLDAHHGLQHHIDRTALCRIENPPLTSEYFQKLVAALGRAVAYRTVVLTEIGKMPYADMVAEVADRIIMLEGMEWAVCFGTIEQRLYLSVRGNTLEQDAGQVVKEALGDLGVGGGHDRMAAGRVELAEDTEEEYVARVTELWNRFLAVLGEEGGGGRRLISDYPYPLRVSP